MYGRFQGENFVRSRLTVKMSGISPSGNKKDVFDINVSPAPTITSGWVFVDFNDDSKKDLIYFHDNVGGVLKYYRKDRDSLGNGSIALAHEVNAFVQINDVTERINYLFNNVNDFGNIVDSRDNNVVIAGGNVNYAGTVVVVSDTTLSSLADGTHRIVLDYDDGTIKSVAVVDYTKHLYLYDIVIASSLITSTTKKFHIDVHSNRSVLDGLSDVGGVLYYNGSPV